MEAVLELRALLEEGEVIKLMVSTALIVAAVEVAFIIKYLFKIIIK